MSDATTKVGRRVTVDRPHWDAEQRELWLGEQFIHRFVFPAPNQEYLLTAFEELNWPEVMDDPLPGGGKANPKRRLREAVRDLNRAQAAIVFAVRSCGQKVGWKLINEV